MTIHATSAFDAPVMDQNGMILVRAHLTGAATSGDDRAYLIGRSRGDLRVAVRAGDQAPGLAPGILLRSSSVVAGSAGLSASPRISPFGEFLLFQSALHDPINPGTTPTTADTALFWGAVDNLQCLAREGDPTPFQPQETWGNFASTVQGTQINASGRVSFLASVNGSSADIGVLVTGTPGALEVVSREGDVLSGGEVVIPISGVSLMAFNHQINEAGQVLHEMKFSTAAPSTATLANDQAIAIWTPGSGDAILAREGQPAPGLPGVAFGSGASNWGVEVGGARFTASGRTAFATRLIGPGVQPGIDDGAVFYGGLGGLTVVVRSGDACPGLTNGETFGPFVNNSVTCNDLGDVAFLCTLAGPTVDASNDTSLWIRTGGSLTLIAREGDIAETPTPGGPCYYENLNSSNCQVRLNGRGNALIKLPMNDGTDAISFLDYCFLMHVLNSMTGTDDLIRWFLRLGPEGLDYAPSVISNSGDGGSTGSNDDGDHCGVLSSDTIAPTLTRGHVGFMQATPAAVPAAGGVSHTFDIDLGPANGSRLYFVIASASGSRPGFLSPLGPQLIPLNPDGWLSTSLALANTSTYTNTLGFLDANGRASASLNVPPGVAGLAGITLHHAVVAIDPFSLVSTAVSEPTSVRFY